MSFADIIKAGGAECELCGQRMLIADGCKCEYVEVRGKRYKRVKVCEEEFDWGAEHCHDCGAKAGFYHHYGCDAEECPVCGNQLIGCGCDLEFVEVEL